MNKKVIALSLFFIFGIACFSIISMDNVEQNNNEKIINYIENYGISKKLSDSNNIKIKYLYENKKPYIHKIIEDNN